MSSEAGPELSPVFFGEFVPTADGGIEEVGGVAVEGQKVLAGGSKALLVLHDEDAHGGWLLS